MPLPPFSLLKNIHNLANSLFRRLAQQAKDQKRVVAFGDEESANRFKTAHDGEGIYWDGVMKPENLEAGGIDQRSFGLLIQVKDIFSWSAGNLDSLGGLSPMSETIGQDEMLARSASAQLADMQDATSEFAKSIFNQLAWYEWIDPTLNRILQKPIKGTDIVVSVLWTPETRQGDFLKFNFDIIPQSMREDTPAAKVQKLQAVITNFYGPLMPFFEQQGRMIDVDRLNKMIADYSNLPELEQLIVAMDPEQREQIAGPQGNSMPMPAQMKRTYERVNRPGATRVGKDMALVQTLMGGNVQPSEAAAIGRGST
jgi:hypothetical protein